MLPNLPPTGQPKGPRDRTIKDPDGTVWRLWEIEAKPGMLGSAYCIVVFVSPTERRWLPALRGALFCEHHNSLLRQLREAKPMRPGKVIPEPHDPDPPKAFTQGEYEEGA